MLGCFGTSSNLAPAMDAFILRAGLTSSAQEIRIPKRQVAAAILHDYVMSSLVITITGCSQNDAITTMAALSCRSPILLFRTALARSSLRLNTTLAGASFENVPEHPHADIPSDGEVQSLEKMPGMRINLALLFNLAKSTDMIHLMHQELWSTLGRIYKIPVPYSAPFIITNNPADVEVLFRTDGETPYRSGLEMAEEFLEEKGLGKGLVLS